MIDKEEVQETPFHFEPRGRSGEENLVSSDVSASKQLDKGDSMFIIIMVSYNIYTLFLEGNGGTYGMHRAIDKVDASDNECAQMTRQISNTAKCADRTWANMPYHVGYEVGVFTKLHTEVNEDDFSHV